MKDGSKWYGKTGETIPAIPLEAGAAGGAIPIGSIDRMFPRSKGPQEISRILYIHPSINKR
jgi:hypothetical protein